MWKTSVTLLFTLLVSVVVGDRAMADQAQVKPGTAPQIIKSYPGLQYKDLTGRSGSDILLFSDGKKVRVDDVRKMAAVQEKLRTRGKSQPPAQFRQTAAAKGLQLKSRGDLSSALKRPDNETVVLPSGRSATVGQIKYVQSEVERRLGRRLDLTSARPVLTGPAIKVTAKTSKDEWKNIFRQPDSTILESPNGKRITVGELKQTIKERRQLRKAGKINSPAVKSNQGGRP